MSKSLTNEEIAHALIGVVQLHAEAAEHSFTEACLGDLRMLALDVAKKVARDRDRRPADLLLAEDGAKALVHRMIASSRQKKYAGVLHEDTLAEAASTCGVIFWCDLWKKRFG